MKTIGILGGMGPQATIDLYQRIINTTPAQCDQDHIPVIIDSYPQIEDRTAYILGNGADPTAKLITAAKRLERAGAHFLIMPCNTAHYFAAQITQAVNIPLLHIATTTIEAVKQHCRNGSTVAVLATDGTHQAKIYAKPLHDAGYNLTPLTKAQQKDVMSAIYAGAKAGKISEYAPILQNVIDTLNANTILLACTELPLFLPYLHTNKLLIDPTQCLAEAAVKQALTL